MPVRQLIVMGLPGLVSLNTGAYAGLRIVVPNRVPAHMGNMYTYVHIYIYTYIYGNVPLKGDSLNVDRCLFQVRGTA